MLRHLLISTLLLPLGTASAALQRYVADEHESSWEANASRLRCELSHEIPLYGRAVFEQAAGGNLQLRVEASLRPHSVGMARLISTAPPWRHDARERDLGQVGYTTERVTFTLPQATSRRLLQELEGGMFPTFSYQDWADGRDQVEVALSAVNLRGALGEFLNCLAGVIPYSFDYVRNTTFSYDEGQVDLTPADRRRLDELTRYLLADPAVQAVTIDSHTDNRGYRQANKEVSRRRAEAVRDYLLAKGVAARLIAIHAYGESRPRASNRSAEGRAKNRYVEVTLRK